MTSPCPRSTPIVVPLSSSSYQTRNRLLHLPFPAFAYTVARLLEQMGYRDVRLMGATHNRGRNQYGGLDLMARLPNDLTQSVVIAQIKQYRRPVPRAFVDELRGTMLRHAAQQGLLITTSSFANSASEAVASAQHSLPIRLIDGQELVALLSLYRVELAEERQEQRQPMRQTVDGRLVGKPISGTAGRIPPAPPLVPYFPVSPKTPRTVTITITIDPSAGCSQSTIR